ncbi:hypothetical protein [Sphingomonas sp.]|jgi:hypothetical protein|uniref:hypothetical protein n=1 Tax=Sphingomonas sp. TaxID=28214 RepID=UPI002E3663F7|nr:hypothetical protein [Sphingomonas sp.]HEX4694800.1 hypothetical protein [Sphingomonas sp.]
MYNDNDLEQAVAAGVLPRDATDAFRHYIAEERHFPRVDEEHYKILDGSSDAFVAFGSVLLMLGLGYIGYTLNHVAAGLAVSVAAWGLAEFFVRVRKLALTGILLSFAFFGGVLATLGLGLYATSPDWGAKGYGGAGAVIFVLGAGAMWLFWKRFAPPIAVSFAALSVALAVMALVVALLGGDNVFALGHLAYPVALVCGLGVFAYAMWWDLSDPNRVTERHEVAFWIHGVAGGLIAQSIFYLIGTTGTFMMFVSTGQVVTLALVFVLFAVVALVIDRRALLFSSAVPLVFALMSTLAQAGAYQTALGWAALFVGIVLLALSAGWHTMRAAIMPMLGEIADRLPPAGPAIERPYEDIPE